MRRDAHDSGPAHYVSVVSGLVFEIYPLDRAGTVADDRHPPRAVQVDSVDDVIPALVEAGGAVVAAPRDVAGGRHAVVTDSDGHRVELFTPTGAHKVTGGE